MPFSSITKYWNDTSSATRRQPHEHFYRNNAFVIYSQEYMINIHRVNIKKKYASNISLTDTSIKTQGRRSYFVTNKIKQNAIVI